MRGIIVKLRLAGSLAAMVLTPPTWGAVSPYIITPPVNQTNFTGDTVTFTVTAGGDAVLQYQWQKNSANLADDGRLSGSTTSSLTLSSITTADYGTYSVTITNAAGATNAGATLTLFARLIQNGGFESGALAPWSITGNTRGFSVQGLSSGYTHTGSRGARIGPDSSLGYLSQSIPTSTGQTYQISFWLKNSGGEPTNEFTLLWNGRTVYEQRNLGAFDWTNLQFSVQATNSDSVLTFGFQNDPSYFGLDDISVLPVPSCHTVTNSPGGFAFSFNAAAGFRYQVQSSTNLFSAAWNGEGGVCFSETNATVRISNPKLYPRQFYRVAVLP